MEATETLNTMNAAMKKAVQHTRHELSSLHTGKATPAMLDSVRVKAYGSSVTLKEVAAVTTPDPRTLMVQPWDRSILKDVEKGIQEANLGLNPVVDGNSLRVPVPDLTGERRRELVKTAAGIAEEGRVRIRQIRRDALESLKTAKNEGTLPEDDFRRLEKEVQKTHDDFIAETNQYFSHKEAGLKKV